MVTLLSDSHGTPHAVAFERMDERYETDGVRCVSAPRMEREREQIGTLTAGQNNSIRGDTPLIVMEMTDEDSVRLQSIRSICGSEDNANDPRP